MSKGEGKSFATQKDEIKPVFFWYCSYLNYMAPRVSLDILAAGQLSNKQQWRVLRHLHLAAIILSVKQRITDDIEK